MIGSMFGFAPEDATAKLPTIFIIQVVATIVTMLVVHWKMRNTTLEAVAQKTPGWLIISLLAVMAFLIIITQGSGDAFIYFQF